MSTLIVLVCYSNKTVRFVSYLDEICKKNSISGGYSGSLVLLRNDELVLMFYTSAYNVLLGITFIIRDLMDRVSSLCNTA